MSARVSDHADFFDRPPLAVRPDEIVRSHSEELLHLSPAFGLMLDVMDGSGQRFADGFVFQRNAQVNQSGVLKHALASCQLDGDRSTCQ